MTEAETRKKQKIEYIIEQCGYMRRGEKLTINNFGKRQDLNECVVHSPSIIFDLGGVSHTYF